MLKDDKYIPKASDVDYTKFGNDVINFHKLTRNEFLAPLAEKMVQLMVKKGYMKFDEETQTYVKS